MLENSNTITFYNMGWQTVPNINISTDKRVKAKIYIAMLHEYLKIVASTPCPKISDTPADKLV